MKQYDSIELYICNSCSHIGNKEQRLWEMVHTLLKKKLMKWERNVHNKMWIQWC